MYSTQPAPDFDATACIIVDDYYSAAPDGDALQDEIAAALRNAHAAGRRAQLAADVAEIRRIVATTNPEPLAAAALTAMADRLAMLNGGR